MFNVRNKDVVKKKKHGKTLHVFYFLTIFHIFIFNKYLYIFLIFIMK